MPLKGRGIAVDEVVLDLEDSVPAAAKDEAREALVAALADGDWAPRTVAVRINAVGTPWFRSDVEELVSRAGERIDAIVVPEGRGRRSAPAHRHQPRRARAPRATQSGRSRSRR